MIRTTLISAALAIGSLATPVIASDNTTSCSQKPVVMVVDGVTNDRQQMAIYGQALKESGLHQNAGFGRVPVKSPRTAATDLHLLYDLLVKLTVTGGLSLTSDGIQAPYVNQVLTP